MTRVEHGNCDNFGPLSGTDTSPTVCRGFQSGMGTSFRLTKPSRLFSGLGAVKDVAPTMQRQIQTAAGEVCGWAGNSWWHNRTPDPGDLSWQARLYVWEYGVPKARGRFIITPVDDLSLHRRDAPFYCA